MPNVTRFQKPQAPKKPSLPLMKRPLSLSEMNTFPELLAFKEATKRKILTFDMDVRYRIRRALEYVDPGRTAATVPELIEYGELLLRGFQPQEFNFQSSHAGGRLELGGAVVDFYLPSLNIAIRIQSTEFHTGSAFESKDMSQMLMLTSFGLTVHDIWEEETYVFARLKLANDRIFGIQGYRVD